MLSKSGARVAVRASWATQARLRPVSREAQSDKLEDEALRVWTQDLMWIDSTLAWMSLKIDNFFIFLSLFTHQLSSELDKSYSYSSKRNLIIHFWSEDHEFSSFKVFLMFLRGYFYHCSLIGGLDFYSISIFFSWNTYISWLFLLLYIYNLYKICLTWIYRTLFRDQIPK